MLFRGSACGDVVREMGANLQPWSTFVGLTLAWFCQAQCVEIPMEQITNESEGRNDKTRGERRHRYPPAGKLGVQNGTSPQPCRYIKTQLISKSLFLCFWVTINDKQNTHPSICLVDLSLYVTVLVITQFPCLPLVQTLNHRKKRRKFSLASVAIMSHEFYLSWFWETHPEIPAVTPTEMNRLFLFLLHKAPKIIFKNAAETSPSRNHCPSSSGESTGSAANRFLSAAAFYRSKKQPP